MLLLIFKSVEDDPEEDPYLQAVRSKFPEVRAAIISPHEFRRLAAAPLDVGGDCNVVLFTSKRAVQFYAELAALPSPSRQLAMICYAVGPATAEAAASAGFRDVRGGVQCGSAAALCDLVVADLQPVANHRILFPCGRVRKDTIEMRLAGDCGFSLTVLEVYEAAEKESLADEMESLMSSPDWTAQRRVTLAFFSPSSVSMVTRRFNSLGADCRSPGRSVQLISIGPSTSQRLGELSINCSCIECASPTIDSFLSAVSLCL